MTKGVTIYFVRHGETYLNFYGRMQGWANAPLTDRGIENVRRSGRGMKEVRFDAVYTSDLTRTQETAGLLLEENQETPEEMEMEALSAFREVFFGSFEGEFGSVTYQKVAEHLGYSDSTELFEQTNLPQRMNAFKEADPFGQAESFMEFWTRVERGLIEIVTRHRDTGDTVLVVAHGGTIRYMLENLIPDLVDPPALLNASVSIVDYYDGAFHLKEYGQTDHFTDQP